MNSVTDPATAPSSAPADELAGLRLRFGYSDSAFGQLHVTTSQLDEPAVQPLLLMNTRSRSLRRMLPLIRPHFRGVIPDIPGTGQSSAPPDGATMADVARCVADYLDRGGIQKVDVFGFHTGHKVATALAAYYPDRIGKLVVAGKTHSIIPDHQARNAAMKAYIARRTPDTAVVQAEGKYVDDGGEQQRGFAALFEANFGFDFAAALRSVQAPTLIVEVTTAVEDAAYGRQGPLLAAQMVDARAVAMAETEATGIEMHVGLAPLATLVLDFLRA